MAANKKQIGGTHYGLSDFQHWDMVVHFRLDYFQGQITKYVIRWRDKGGLQDLEKAAHFLEKYREVAAREEMAAKYVRGPWKAERKADGRIIVVATGRAEKAGRSKRVSGRKVRPSQKEQP